jgi:hypothetical protein
LVSFCSGEVKTVSNLTVVSKFIDAFGPADIVVLIIERRVEAEEVAAVELEELEMSKEGVGVGVCDGDLHALTHSNNRYKWLWLGDNHLASLL